MNRAEIMLWLVAHYTAGRRCNWLIDSRTLETASWLLLKRCPVGRELVGWLITTGITLIQSILLLSIPVSHPYHLDILHETLGLFLSLDGRTIEIRVSS
jgi:hypothetical protein